MKQLDAPVAASGRQAELVAGDLRVTIVEVGGGVRAFTRAGRPVLDGYEPDEMATFAQGQVLIPWPNRLADGRYEFAGRTHQLPLTEPAKHNAIHGLARWVNCSSPTMSRPGRGCRSRCIRRRAIPSRVRSPPTTRSTRQG